MVARIAERLRAIHEHLQELQKATSAAGADKDSEKGRLAEILRRPEYLQTAKVFDLMLAVTTMALALVSLRHIPLFVAAATPALVSSWSDALRPLGERLRAWRRPAAPSAARSASALLALVLMTLVIGAAVARAEGREDQVVRQLYPVAAVDRLMADPASCGRIFNDYGWGGYLIDRLSADARRRVFIYGEADVMGDALIYRWRNIMEVGPGWRASLDRSGADCVIVPPDAPVAGALSTQPDWRLVYADHVAVLYKRRTP